VLNVPSDDSEEELSWNSSDDEEVDSHVTLTPVNPNGPQESSSVLSFVTSMLNPTSDVGVESIFTTASSPIVSLQTPTLIMTPSTIATITTSGDAPIPPPTIPSIILENLPTFNSAFCFDERLRSLETFFSEYRQTNPFVDAVSTIPVDLSEMEGNKSIQRSDEQQNLYKALVEAYDADKAIMDTYGESTILKRRREDDDQEGPSAGSDQGSKRQKEGGEHASTSTPSKTATRDAGRTTKGSQSRQLSASESAFVKEPAQTTCQIEEPPHPVFETGADDQPIVQTSQHPECIPDTMCDVHLVNNSTPLEAKDHFEIVMNSNDDISSNDDDSLYNENIEYVVASPHDSKVVSLEVAEIVTPKVKEIEDDNLREKLLNVHLLIPNIEALKDNHTPSSKFLTKSSSTSPKSFLEETNTFHTEFENFYFDLEEISSGSITTHSDISLSDYEAFSFSNDHIKEISSGSTTTHCDVSLSEYDSFTFDLSNDQCPPTDRSDLTHEEFADELAHIISPPEYDCFYFWNLPDPGELMSILNYGIRENLSTTCVNLPIED
nr:hypothetical protein [Tanacetum cinerariifolium]